MYFSLACLSLATLDLHIPTMLCLGILEVGILSLSSHCLEHLSSVELGTNLTILLFDNDEEVEVEVEVFLVGVEHEINIESLSYSSNNKELLRSVNPSECLSCYNHLQLLYHYIELVC